MFLFDIFINDKEYNPEYDMVLISAYSIEKIHMKKRKRCTFPQFYASKKQNDSSKQRVYHLLFEV